MGTTVVSMGLGIARALLGPLKQVCRLCSAQICPHRVCVVPTRLCLLFGPPCTLYKCTPSGLRVPMQLPWIQYQPVALL